MEILKLENHSSAEEVTKSSSVIAIQKFNPVQDWQQVQSLLDTTPMSSSLPLVAARPKDFEMSYPFFSGTTIDLVAKVENRVVGYLHGRQEKKMALKNGEWVEVDFVYLGDFRVDKSYRRLGIAAKLRSAIIQYFIDHKVEYGWSVVVSGNYKMMQFFQQISKNAQPALEYTVASRLLLNKPRNDKKEFSYSQFEPSKIDFDDLAKKLRQRFLGPAVSGSDIQKLFQKYPEIQFYKRKDQPGISFALWNQMNIKQNKFIQLPYSIKMISLLWNTISFFTGSHRFPGLGKPLRSAEVSMLVESQVAHDFEEFIVFEAYKMGCHIVNFNESGLGKGYPVMKIKGPAYRLKLKLMSYGVGDIAPLLPPDSSAVDIDLAFV